MKISNVNSNHQHFSLGWVYLLKRCLSTLRLPVLDLSNRYTNSNNNTCLSKNRFCRVESEKWFTGVNYRRNCGINHDLLIKQWDIKDLLVKLWDRTRTRLIQYSLILLDIQLTPATSEKKYHWRPVISLVNYSSMWLSQCSLLR